MPIGVIVNALSILIGGIVGTIAGNKLTDGFKKKINMILGCCSMGMGISAIILMENMPAVVFSIIIGTTIGLVIRLGDRINTAAVEMNKIVEKIVKTPKPGISHEEFTATLVTCIVLFCASGTGIYGAIVSGMMGDHSILIAKSILDIFSAAIFACTLGAVVSIVSIPQFIIFLILFFCAELIIPMTNKTMIADFKACGGFIMLATGFRMINVKMFPVADMIPSMVIVMPISAFWVSYIVPLVS
jgi:uncharacterized membrane protein YqgA involved in biofilm formation